VSGGRFDTSVLPPLSGDRTQASPARERVLAVVRRGRTLGVTCLVTALFAPWIVLAGSGRRILLAVVLLDIPFQIDQNFAYRYDAAELGALGGFNISLTTIALAGLYAAWILDHLVHRHHSPDVPARLLLPLALYVSLSGLSVVTALDAGLYARGMSLLLQMFLLYVYLVGTVRTASDVTFVVAWLLCGLALESLIILGLGLAGEGFNFPGVAARVDLYSDEFGVAARFGGTVGSPNNAGMYLEMLLAPAIAVLATTLGRPYKVLAVLGLGLGSAALMTTYSRGSWLAASLSLVIVCLSLWRGRRLSPAVPVVFLVLLSAIALLFHEAVSNRLTGDDRGAARSRVSLMGTAFEIIEDDPVRGVGANNYTAALERRMSLFGNQWLFTVHNQYLIVWAETGLAGLAAFLWFLLAALRYGWQRWRRADALLSPLALGFTAALAGQMVHMHVDLFNSRPQLQLLVTVAALLAVMSRMEPRSRWSRDWC
jgi:putative inorganic carbon (hco3(-)) transporter